MEELPIYEAIVALKKQGEGAVLVTVVDNSGSTPRKAGAKMLVRADGTTMGTVGGGRVEAEMVDAAAQVLREGRPRTAEYHLDERSGLVCGGRMLLYLEPLLPSPRLLIVGRGHIGQALEGLAGRSGFSVFCFDPPAVSEQDDKEAVEELYGRLSEAAGASKPAVVIASPSHPQDFSASLAALRTDASFIGLVGSRRKRRALEAYLEERGVGASDCARIVSPVGLEIGAETPAEIAVSILAQLIERKRVHAAEDIGHPAGRGKIPAHGAEQAAASPG